MKKNFIFALLIVIGFNCLYSQENETFDKDIPSSTVLYWAKAENKLNKYKNYNKIKNSGLIYYGICSDSGSGIKDVTLYIDEELQTNIEVYYSKTPITEIELKSKRKFAKWLVDADFTRKLSSNNEGQQIIWKIRAEKNYLRTGEIYIKTTDWNNNVNIQNPTNLFIKIYRKDMFGNNITGLYKFIKALLLILLLSGIFLFIWISEKKLEDCFLYTGLTLAVVIILWILLRLMVFLFKVVKGNIKTVGICLFIIGLIICCIFLVRLLIKKDIFKKVQKYNRALSQKRENKRKTKEEENRKKKNQKELDKQQQKMDAEREEKVKALKQEQKNRIIEQETLTISDDIKNITAITNDIEEYTISKQLTQKILFDNLKTIEMSLIQIDEKRSEKIVLTENQKRELKRNKEKIKYLLRQIKQTKEEKKQLTLIIKSIKSYYKNFIK